MDLKEHTYMNPHVWLDMVKHNVKSGDSGRFQRTDPEIEALKDQPHDQLIGLKDKLQENSIFHGKIYGFLSIFPSTNPLTWVLASWTWFFHQSDDSQTSPAQTSHQGLIINQPLIGGRCGPIHRSSWDFGTWHFRLRLHMAMPMVPWFPVSWINSVNVYPPTDWIEFLVGAKRKPTNR